MSIERDIIERIRSDFRAEECECALELLSKSGETARIARCIVLASHGSVDSLKDYIRMAKSDFRDVVMSGEYDRADRRIRDLSVSFLIDKPEKMWVSEIALVMASRGYSLLSLDACAAAAGPFDYTADFGEGCARFIGPKGEIEIVKMDGQWMIHGDSRELELCDLNHPFTNENVFRDAVSGYLLRSAQ